MKVDIITRHSVPNYGSLLQSYATVKVIEKIGHEAEIINYTRYEERLNNLAKSLVKGKKWDKNFFLRFLYIAIQKPNYMKMYKKFEKYRKNFLKETPIEYGNLEELRENIPVADVYCSGSDQIWGKIGTSSYDKAYFLEFIDGNKRCIAYSSSFGKSEIDKELKSDICGFLKKYETILVREDSAKKILEELNILNVEQVLDPTFLLNREEWEKLANLSKVKRKDDYVLVYQLHYNKDFEKYAKDFSKRTGLKLLRLSPSMYDVVRTGKLIYLPNQYDFLNYIKNAKYVLTDSFHATAFSIIFNKQFINILPNKTSTRILSILKLLSIKNRIIKDFNDFSMIDNDIDYREVNKLLKKEQNRSLELLKKAIEGNKKNINLLNKHYKCTGCRMCEQICPKNAIKMKENSEGFLEPVIDEKKCINCTICYNKCPQINGVDIDKERIKQQVFAAKNKNEEEQKNSSSGGIFSNIADYILENNGIVYGASFKENLKLNHIRIESKKDLERLIGSKYIQSNICDSFENVKKDLENNKNVLFVGTPCQIGGLRNYLGKEYNKLFTIDLVCHGVPNQKLFDKYINWMEKTNKSKVKKYYFRSKDKNKWGLNLKIVFENNKIKYIPAALDPYYKSFLKGIVYRECCYSCQYANLNRIGDITLADYWGIEVEHPTFYDEKGISAILINTEKGMQLFRNIKENIEYIDTNIEKVTKHNANLVKPTFRDKIRDNAYREINDKKFNVILKNDLKFKKEIRDQIKNIIPLKLKRKIKNILKKR